jgi:hypothetical protein
VLISIEREDLCLLTKDYKILNEFVSLLTLFAEATTITPTEKTSSISFIVPTILTICYDLLNEQSNMLFYLTLCEVLLCSLISWFDDLLDVIDIDIDKIIKKKSSSEHNKDEILIYSPFLNGKFKLYWITESLSSLEKNNSLYDKIKWWFCIY